MDIASLDAAVHFYCNRGLADSTRRTYRSGLDRFLSFCYVFGVTSPFPVSETLLCYFVTSLAREGIAPATIKTYLAAIRHAQIMRGHPEPREASSLPRLRLLQTGVRRERARSGPPGESRLPITPDILRRMRPFCQPAAPSYDQALLWATMTVCFFGFFRAGEITVSTVGSFDPAVHLAWGDVSISENSRVVRVFLKRSKTDQFARGTEVFIGATGDELCPVAAISRYVAIRGTGPGAFFRSAEGIPLTKARFVEQVRSALARAGLPLSGYSGHSFRIGAATTAAQAGIPDSVIQALGRWSSQAFLRYIRRPREQLAQYSHPLVGRS